MNFTVIDFETANNQRASACSLGIVKVVNGQIVEKGVWLIKPYDMHFDYRNIEIHGITPADVINEPEFDVLYHKIFKEKLEGQLVVAHNASFDMSVLRESLKHYKIEFPTFDYLCTVKIAQKTWPDLSNHKLDTVSKFIKFEFKHHDALEDCLASAHVLLAACKTLSVQSPIEAAKHLKLHVGKMHPEGYQACGFSGRR